MNLENDMNKEEMMKSYHEMMFGRWGLVSRDEYEEMKKKAEELAEENARLKQNKAYTESPLVMLIDYLKRIDELETKVAKLEVELAKTQSDVRSVGYPQW
jgi:BMFP domain-containing protein YqiC